MPGTFGTLLGWLIFAVLADRVTPVTWLLVVVVGFLVGVWACARTGRDLGVADHGAMVWDEMVAIWLVLAFLPAEPGWHLAGFVLFRLFDMTKPSPIRRFERLFKNGFGVMADDLLAAFYTLLVLAVWARL